MGGDWPLNVNTLACILRNPLTGIMHAGREGGFISCQGSLKEGVVLTTILHDRSFVSKPLSETDLRLNHLRLKASLASSNAGRPAN